MTAATIIEIRALLDRLLDRHGNDMAAVEFSMNTNHRLQVLIRGMKLDGSDRAAHAEVPDESEAERRAGSLAYRRRVTLAMQALEDAVTKPATAESQVPTEE